jgi:hypothetical protein
MISELVTSTRAILVAKDVKDFSSALYERTSLTLAGTIENVLSINDNATAVNTVATRSVSTLA